MMLAIWAPESLDARAAWRSRFERRLKHERQEARASKDSGAQIANIIANIRGERGPGSDKPEDSK